MKILFICALWQSDWACGGQWNRAYQFVRLLVDAFNAAHIELIAFFDGTLKENKKSHPNRVEIRQKTISVLKHIRMIGTPPPKIWWLEPSGLRTCVRNALRSLNVIVVCIRIIHNFYRAQNDFIQFTFHLHQFKSTRYKQFTIIRWKSSIISMNINSMAFSV